MNRLLACLLIIGWISQVPARALGFNTVVIDAGHGGKDGGCVHNSLIEKRLCLDVALRLEKALKARGMRVVMTRRTDRYVELSDRAAIANKYSRALFVSIHFNACRDRSVSGMEVFYRSSAGRSVASKILNSMDANLKGVKRGVFYKDLKVLRATRMTAVLVEGGYLSNKTEARRCADPDHRQEMATAIARGIMATRS